MSIIAGGKDSKLNVCSHRKVRTTSPLPGGESVGVLIAVRKFGNTEAQKIRIPNRS